MFGHKDIDTTATVVAIREASSLVEVNGKYQYEVVLDVAATDGPPFRVTTEHRFFTLFSPNVGDVVRVSYDPKSHKTKIHSDGDPRYDIHEHEKQRHQEEKASVEAAMAQPPGTAPDPFDGAQYDPELAELVAEERRQMAAAQAPEPSAVTPSPAAIPAPLDPGRLEHLEMLRDSGILTPEEFETLRKQLPAGS